MSASAAMGRIEQIQQMVTSLAAGPPKTASADATASPTAFANQLKSAQTTAATPQVAGATATTGAPAAGLNAKAASVPYAAEIDAAASKYGLDPALLRGLIRAESNFDPTAGSPVGARGLTQLMPGTAASMGVTDLTDPAQQLDGGAKYLKEQLEAFGGDVTKALAAYNAGPGAVKKFGGVPPYAETQNYVKKVQEYADEYRAPAAAVTTAPAATTTPQATTAAQIAAAMGGATGTSGVTQTSMSTAGIT